MKKKDGRIFFRYTILCAGVLLFAAGCTRREKSELIWDKDFPRIGSQSSPRATDLNDDGVLDIVIGAGENEYQKSDQGILAFDGKSGDLLWQAPSDDQMYGCATLHDITGDGTEDVFIGGRSPYFKALNGRTGKVIWEYSYHHEKDSILKHARFNFNNSVLVPDQNGDGVPDLLTVNGGNSKAAPYSNEKRFPGVMILFDSKSGNILAADTMPDGRESYMSPVCFTRKDSEDPIIIFGTGGETISGNLYEARLNDLLQKKLSNAKIIASENGHGFIAPPTLADITGDGYLDVAIISHGSTVFAIDGHDHKVLWKRNIPDTESSNSLAAGYFTDDKVPDFFTFVSKGQWPNSAGSIQIMLDGRDGNVAYMDSMGCTGFSSPVVYDINRDGRDEAIISINEYDCSLGFTGQFPASVENKLIAIDFGKHTTQTIDQQTRFKNIFTTPWIGDMDDDGYLDIVHCQYFHYGDLLNFKGMRIKRIATPIRMKEDPAWGSYMGSHGDGVFR
ncbi:MAG: PQQ-binding-like beta-propeller repeat protein [Chryseosolibacter sp.]